jgi:uncharacterized protein
VNRAARRETPPAGVRICERPGLGFRVVAARQFEPGETIERAPVIDFPRRDWKLVEQTALGGYAFPWGDGGGGVALGYGALYGYSKAPSARCVFHVQDRVLEIVAERDIESGDEILIGDRESPSAVVPSGLVVDPPADIVWGESAGRGRGVFAVRAFVAGERIECTPCLTFPARDWKAIEQTRFDDYCFVWGDNGEDGALPLGYGSVYNHSFQPNATYFRRLAEHLMEFVAIRDIAAGDEIRTNYNRDPEDMSPVWFELVP